MEIPLDQVGTLELDPVYNQRHLVHCRPLPVMVEIQIQVASLLVD